MDAVVFLFGVLMGSLIRQFLIKTKNAGSLRVDRSEPDEPPKLFLELNVDMNTLSSSDFIKLQVKNENYISQK